MSGVLDRVPSEEWLKQFITNQDSLIKVRDEYTVEIMKESKVEWSHNFKELERLYAYPFHYPKYLHIAFYIL